MHHLNEEDLILLHYGEALDATGPARHLDACAACRAAYEALRVELTAITAWEPPPRDAHYGERVWARVQPHLLSPQRLSSRGIESLPASLQPRHAGWLGGLRDLLKPRGLALAAYGASVAALIFVLVQASPEPDEVSQQTRPAMMDEARERVLLSSLGDHFDRSQIMLLELANQEEVFDSPRARESAREWAQDLLATNRLYRRAAASDGEAVMADVLDDLERTLLHVAHAPGELQEQAVSLQATRADAREMLFKLRVAGDTVRARERAAFEDEMPEKR
ncbi:MAG: hypothetical protein GEU99_11530 [Luteitalea sp.]|nr:hypothetical protein [Luteitalea sp.]